MRFLAHVILSAVVSLFVYMVFNMRAALCAFLAGISVDGDHVIDFLLWSEDKRLRSLTILGIGFFKPHIIDIFFHSYELLVPLLVVAWTTSATQVGWGLTIGFVAHLAADQVYNMRAYKIPLLNYFLSYRIIKYKDRLSAYERQLAMFQAVMERDNFKCRVCGSTEDLEIHEKNPRGLLSLDSDVSSDHFITICRKCHTKKHRIF